MNAQTPQAPKKTAPAKKATAPAAPAPEQQHSGTAAPAQTAQPVAVPAPQPAPEPEYVPVEEETGEKLAPNVADHQLATMVNDQNDSPLGIGDIAIPRLVITQPTSSFEGATENPGKWFNSVTGEFKDVMEVVLVRVAVQRAVFPQPFDPNVPVLCSSPDAIRPYPEYIRRVVHGINIEESCAECPLSQWGAPDDVQGRGDPPKCSLMYLYTGLEYHTAMPFSLRLKGTAIPVAKKINFLYQQFGPSVVLQLATMPGKSTTNRKFYVPTIATTGLPTPDFLLPMIEKMKAGAGRREAEPAPAVVTPEDDDIPF